MQLNRCFSCRIYVRQFILFSLLSFQLTGTAARCSGSIHTGILQYLDELATKCTDVLFDLVHVVFRYALIFRLALLNGDVSSYQISHDTLIPKVPFGSLLDLSLRIRNRNPTVSKIFVTKYTLRYALYTSQICRVITSRIHVLDLSFNKNVKRCYDLF